MLLTDSQLNMLRRVRKHEKLELYDISDEEHRDAVRLSLDGYVYFHGSRSRRTGYYTLTLKGWSALEV